jgi:hypothetical protein
MNKVDITKIKLSYKDVLGSGKEISATIDQEVPCVEFTLKGNVPQPITYTCMPPEYRHKLYAERWIQFEPKAWTQMMDEIFTEMVKLWNDKYGNN